MYHHHLYQSTPIHHPLPQQNPNPHPLTYNPSIYHSPSISSQVTPTTPQNLNQLCISLSSAPTFNRMQNHLSSKSKKNTYPNQNIHTKKQNNNNKKPHNFKPRFRPIEHPPTSPPYTPRKTDTTTTTQHNPTNPQSHSHTVHSSSPQNHRHSIYSTSLPEPLFHPYQIPTSFNIPTKHPSYITTHTQIYTIR